MTVNDYKNAIDDLMRDAIHNLSEEKFKDLAELVAVIGNAYLTAMNKDNFHKVGWRHWEREEFATQLFLQDIEDWKSEGSD